MQNTKVACFQEKVCKKRAKHQHVEEGQVVTCGNDCELIVTKSQNQLDALKDSIEAVIVSNIQLAGVILCKNVWLLCGDPFRGTQNHGQSSYQHSTSTLPTCCLTLYSWVSTLILMYLLNIQDAFLYRTFHGISKLFERQRKFWKYQMFVFVCSKQGQC